MKNKINRALVAKKKHYIYPKTESVTLTGALIMLGASGDIHSNTGQGTQSENHAPKKLF